MVLHGGTLLTMEAPMRTREVAAGACGENISVNISGITWSYLVTLEVCIPRFEVKLLLGGVLREWSQEKEPNPLMAHLAVSIPGHE